jgi:hypothetical protein
MTFHPRLEASVGWLLKGALGYSTPSSGSGGIKYHTFALDPVNPGFVPWMGFRKFIPTDGGAGNYGLGETYKDCKITYMGLTLTNEGLIEARVDALGRLFILEESPAWGISSGSDGGWNAASGEFESYPSIPIGSVPGGYISTPAFGELPVLRAMVGMTNTPVDIRQERVYGSPFIDDVTVVSRAANLDLTVKWRNPDLYRQILTGAITGTEWNAVPFTTSLDFQALSPANMPSESLPYSLRVQVTEAMLALQGGIVLAGNDAVVMRFTGVALDVTGDYVVWTLANQFADYVWPT